MCARAQVLRAGGHFVFKVFQGGNERELVAECTSMFKHVHTVKPPSSRAGSAEVFVVCLKLQPCNRSVER